MNLSEARQAASVIENNIPHNNVTLLLVFGEVKEETVNHGSLKHPTQKLSWALTDIDNQRRKIPCREDSCSLQDNARNIISAFGLQPNRTGLCLISDSLHVWVDVEAIVPNQNPSNPPKSISFGITPDGKIIRREQ